MPGSYIYNLVASEFSFRPFIRLSMQVANMHHLLHDVIYVRFLHSRARLNKTDLQTFVMHLSHANDKSS